ncbi:MAG: DUF4956 domain-containing protein [Sandaracinaceae bacterium]|nr:DUF4956 domain-containing protein [Sandaracinaceae bacterium]
MSDFVQWIPDSLALSHPSWLASIKALVGAFVMGQVIAWIYERTYQGLSYSKRFTETLILVSICAAVLVMAIGRSIYAGLGLLGMLSIIRFRSNLKTPRDLVFLLAAVVFGVAAGIDAIAVAVIGILAFSAVTLYLHYGPFGSRSRFDGILRFRVTSGADVDAQVRELLASHCARSAALSIGEVAQGELVEHTYQVKFARDEDRDELLTALRGKPEVRDARLLMQEVTLEY